MSKVKISIIMGSQSDWPTMKEATIPLEAMNIDYHSKIVSAHRTPDRLFEFGRGAYDAGYRVIIAGAGGAAHLPGMMAAVTDIPVVAVPVISQALNGMDSLLSIVQMPRGIAVATQAIGAPGAFNAGVMAVQMLAIHDPKLRAVFAEWRSAQTASVPEEVGSCTLQ